VWSPDGKWVAYESDTKEGSAIVRRPAVGGPEETLLSGADQLFPEDWSSDGKYILYVNFYLGLNGTLMAVPVATEGGQLRLGAPQPLFRTNTVSYDVAAGGKKFLLDLVGDQGSKPITLVTNWPAELKK
jgi:Tol biopolymer transport system component